MKVGTDGVLLGAWARLAATDEPPQTTGSESHAAPIENRRPTKRVLDVGTGCGLVALLLAQRFPEAHLVALEIDPQAAEQAAENVARSRFPSRRRPLRCHCEQSAVFRRNASRSRRTPCASAAYRNGTHLRPAHGTRCPSPPPGRKPRSHHSQNGARSVSCRSCRRRMLTRARHRRTNRGTQSAQTRSAPLRQGCSARTRGTRHPYSPVRRPTFCPVRRTLSRFLSLTPKKRPAFLPFARKRVTL